MNNRSLSAASAGFETELPPDAWSLLRQQVVEPGYCAHCGLCAGLNPDLVRMEETSRGPLPVLGREPSEAEAGGLRLARACCPGRGVPFPEVFEFLDRRVASPLLGPYVRLYTGYASDESVRRRAASGGILSSTLIHMLETGEIGGAVVLQQGRLEPERATPFIATSRDEILAAAQSVYAVTPMLDILPEMERFPGRLAFVGLPEQVAALRMLEAAGHPVARKLALLAGPYAGTNMYHGAVRAFLRARGVSPSMPIRAIEWRAGEWPGYLQVETADGRVFKAAKFYYNYLIPFFISRNCLQTPDFANETADLSVGDAWSPALERSGGGHSIIVTRSVFADELIQTMARSGKISLREIHLDEAIGMHAHMIDFKKRGSFLRLDRERRRGKPAPRFGYRPAEIPRLRRFVEAIIGVFLWAGRQRWARGLVSRTPVGIAGPVFSVTRRVWKSASKPAKRKGLATSRFETEPNPERWREILDASERQ